jgi:choline-glycine betaine transporter
LIPAERTSAAAGIIILPILVIAMFSAALGLGDGIAELCVIMSFPGTVAQSAAPPPGGERS